MFDVNTYLRCDQGHPNAVPMRERDVRVGVACTTCGHPLLATPPRERPAFRPRY